MNFDFSEEQRFIQSQARDFLARECTPARVREVLESEETHHAALWRQVCELGWPATAIPETWGGLGLGYLELCLIAEELGRAVAPLPFSSSTYLAAELLLAAGTDAQKARWLPGLASGECIGALADAEGVARPGQVRHVRFENDRLDGDLWPVVDGGCAHLGIVVAQEPGLPGASLVLVELGSAGVGRRPLAAIDPSRKLARLEFHGVPAERLGGPGQGGKLLRSIHERAAVLLAFEQVGLAEACLHMAREYTSNRYAFGRPVASFQAIKHKLADMFVELELARSNAYYGAWALSSGSQELPLAAATARVSATEAARLAAKENIQAHGGMGFTWEFDCHLYYRRAQHLALLLGGTPGWKQRVAECLLASPAD